MLRDNIDSLYPDEADEEGSEKTFYGGPQIFRLSGSNEPRSSGRGWSCWVAASLPNQGNWKRKNIPERTESSELIILEFELEHDSYNPLMSDVPESPSLDTPLSGSSGSNAIATGNVPHVSQRQGASSGADDEGDVPLTAIIESTTSYSKPLRTLMAARRGRSETPSSKSSDSSSSVGRRSGRRSRRGGRATSGSSDTLDVFSVLNEINEQLDQATDLDTYLKIVVGVVKDVCQFHRVLIYKFDEEMNGEVVKELVDWSHTHELYMGLKFPASDIPPQARRLYRINKVRFLYDGSQPTARLVLRDKADLDRPLDMTHCFLRAMSPIHIQCTCRSSRMYIAQHG